MHEYESLSAGDEWLKRYTYDSVGIYPGEDVLQELLAWYPFEGGVLYRGLNFLSRETWEAFLETTENGTVLEAESITSWAKSESTAHQFSVQRPTYFLDKELKEAESQKRQNNDYMVGHAGAILKITLPENVAVDVTKSRYEKEDEVILPPGKYKIEMHKVLEPFMRSITEDNYGAELMQMTSLRGNPEAHMRFNHIIRRFSDYSDSMRARIFDLITEDFPNLEVQVSRTDPDNRPGRAGGKLIELYIGWNFPWYLIEHYDKFLPEHRARVDSMLNEAALSIDNQFNAITADINWERQRFYLMIDQSVREAIDSERITPDFPSKINAGVGQYYRHMNSLEVTSTITTRDEHANHAKLIHHALSQMIRNPKAADLRRAKAAKHALETKEHASPPSPH
jgi:hypothetical protein